MYEKGPQKSRILFAGIIWGLVLTAGCSGESEGDTARSGTTITTGLEAQPDISNPIILSQVDGKTTAYAYGFGGGFGKGCRGETPEDVRQKLIEIYSNSPEVSQEEFEQILEGAHDGSEFGLEQRAAGDPNEVCGLSGI